MEVGHPPKRKRCSCAEKEWAEGSCHQDVVGLSVTPTLSNCARLSRNIGILFKVLILHINWTTLLGPSCCLFLCSSRNDRRRDAGCCVTLERPTRDTAHDSRMTFCLMGAGGGTSICSRACYRYAPTLRRCPRRRLRHLLPMAVVSAAPFQKWIAAEVAVRVARVPPSLVRSRRDHTRGRGYPSLSLLER